MPATAAALLVAGLLASPRVRAAEERIAAIDTYGLVTVSRVAVLEAVDVRAGDPEPDGEGVQRIVRALEAVPGVEEADVSVVRYRAGSPPGAVQPIVYVGVREAGRAKVAFHAEPSADVRLPDELVAVYDAFEKSHRESMRRGDWSEDDSNGYALLGDEATRAIQRQLVPLADQHFQRLVEVLRTAKSARQRKIAATVLAFAGDKTKIAAELAAAARDPDRGVRNNATRALGILIDYAHGHPELAIDAPVEPYFDLLESLEWTDRNKAMFVLLELTEDGDGALLEQLADRCLPALVEMARWSAEGHAVMAYLLVGRIAGLKDAELGEAWRAENVKK